MKIFKKPIFYIVLFAFLIRLSGLFFGLPQADVFGDEIVHTIIAFKILDAKSLILPFEFKHYLPPLYSYMLIPVYGLIGVLGMVFNFFSGIEGFTEFVILYREWFLAPSRILSAVFGAGTVYLIYLFAKKLFSEKVAILSAFLLAVNFLHVHESQIGHIWSPIVFFIVLSVYGFFRLYLTGERKWYIVSILGIGLGYAMGQIGIIFYPFFLLAHYLYVRKSLPDNKAGNTKFLSKNFVEANIWLIAIIILFTVLNFYTVYKHFYDVALAFFKFLNLNFDYLPELSWVYPERVENFSISGNWIFITKTLFYNFPVIFIFSILGAFALFKKLKLDFRNILIFCLPIFTLIIFSFIFYSFLCRYTLPVIPFMIISASYAIFWIYEKFNKKIILFFLLFLISLYSVLASGLYSYKLLKPYTVSMAVEWVYKNVSSESRVLSDIYINSNKESIEFLKENNMFNWVDTRKKYLSDMKDERYPEPSYFVIDTNLTDPLSLPEGERQVDYALISFYKKEGKEEENKKMKFLDAFGDREKMISFYPKIEKKYIESLINVTPHFFLKNIWGLKYIGPNVEIYKFNNDK